MSTTPQTEAGRLADGLLAETSKFGKPSIQRGLVNGAIQELRRLDAENKAMQSKLDADLALITKQADLLLDQKQTIYSFHYAMKDAGWHPGRTDDDLTDIIRQKGKALAEAEVASDQLREQIALAVAKEREECAKVCDAQADEWDSDQVVTLKNYAGYCAESIRARGEA